MASSGTRGAAAMGTPRPPGAQVQNLKQERKLTKCVTCGNTAMGKCDFRACGTCCVRARNPCQAHGFKQGTIPLNPSTPETPPRPTQFQWVPGMGLAPYRPPNGQVASPYHINPMMRYRVPYTSPIVRMPTPPPVETEDQKEARLEKARKNFIYAQKEALMINSWRVIKMRAFADADLSFEDEAFDRYMRSCTLLESVVGLDDEIKDALPETSEEQEPDSKQDDLIQDAVSARYDSKNKELQRQKLQKAIAKSFAKLRKKEAESENMLEIREFNQQAGIGRRDTKRMKVQTPDGKECLRRINAWEDLFQGIGSFSSSGEMRNYLEQFSTREASRGEQVNAVAPEEKSPRVQVQVPPVRRLATMLMKNKSAAQISETQREPVSRVELPDESLSKVYENSQEDYTLETL